MTLYEIDDAILECVDQETGEVINEEALADLQMEREKKIHNIAAYIINLKAMEAAAKERKDRFAAKEKAARNKREALNAYLDRQLAGKKWSDDDFNIYWTKSEKTDVYDEDAVPVDYKIPQPYKLDTMGIKRTLKMGKSVPGARLIESQNIQVK
jgi:hypothetical protein